MLNRITFRVEIQSFFQNSEMYMRKTNMYMLGTSRHKITPQKFLNSRMKQHPKKS